MEICLESEEVINRAIDVIHSGGVVAHATETCYGLACDMTNFDAVKKLFAIKNRPDGMPVSALFPSVDEARKWVEWNTEAQKLADAYLPGPLTIVVSIRKGEHLATCISGAYDDVCRVQNTIGVRISSHSVARKIAVESGCPVSTTSANVHGLPETYSSDDIVHQMEKSSAKPDIIIDSGVLPKSSPSTIVSVVDGTMAILRQGSINIAFEP